MFGPDSYPNLLQISEIDRKGKCHKNRRTSFRKPAPAKPTRHLHHVLSHSSDVTGIACQLLAVHLVAAKKKLGALGQKKHTDYQ